MWVRALLLNKEDILKITTPKLKEAYPELAHYIDSYNNAKDANQKKFLASYLILKNPGMSPYLTAGLGRREKLAIRDDYGENWWIPIDPSTKSVQPVDESDGIIKWDLTKYLNNQQKTDSNLEKAFLFGKGDPTHFLVVNTINWANVNRADDRIPEALAIAIKIPCYGARVAGSSQYSKEA